MNLLHVIVSISLLLVLAGFNNAHGLTTFGKTQPTARPRVEGVPCKTQNDCLTSGTTCLRQHCYCGDNTFPENGICKASKRGPRHVCSNDNQCVEGADCLEDKNKTVAGATKICVCQEGMEESGAQCGGESNFVVLPGLALIVTLLARSLN